MRLVWTRPAIAIRRAIFDRIRQDSPAAAKRMAKRLRDRANSLLISLHQGRRGRVEGTLELVVTGTPYLIIYAVTAAEIRILTILHHAQQWPPAEL